MADPRPYDLAILSYGEVLDATKHQDDKIGRLLTAVAFLTAGALVFANRDILASTYSMGGRPYRLTAFLLGLFLLIDLAAVVLWLLAVSTPLTFPSGVSAQSKRSYLFFLVIGETPRQSWEAMWSPGKPTPGNVVDDLVSETYNLARRARRKYDQSRVASLIFLASVVFLVPALVLALDTVSEQKPAGGDRLRAELTVVSGGAPPSVSVRDPDQPRAAHWSQTRRVLVAVPVAALVTIFVLARFGEARAEYGERGSRDSSPFSVRLVPLLAFTQAAFVLSCVVANGSRPPLTSGALAVMVAGGATTWVLWRVLPSRRDPRRGGFSVPSRRTQLLCGTVALTAAGTAAVLFDRPEVQLFVALAAACLVLVEVRQRPPLPELEVAPDSSANTHGR